MLQGKKLNDLKKMFISKYGILAKQFNSGQRQVWRKVKQSKKFDIKILEYYYVLLQVWHKVKQTLQGRVEGWRIIFR